MATVIRTTGFNQHELISDILTLYSPTGIDCDLTYSKGNFYKTKLYAKPRHKFDIKPQTSDTKQASSTKVPLRSGRMNCVMFDPPFLASTGPSLSIQKKNTNTIVDRFGCFPNEDALHTYYIDSLKESYRIIKDNGILIFKCQDKVSSSIQYFSHCFIWQEAIKLGFYPIDMFVLFTNSRIISGKHANQKHARKFHSYFWVFKKVPKKVKYTKE